MRSWLLAILASACWTERAPAPATPAAPLVSTPSAWTFPGSGIRFATRQTNRCTRVIEKVMDQSRNDMIGGGVTAEMLDDVQAQAIASCEALGWELEALDCWEIADTQTAIGECFQKLTPEQQRDFSERINEAMKRRTSGISP